MIQCIFGGNPKKTKNEMCRGPRPRETWPVNVSVEAGDSESSFAPCHSCNSSRSAVFSNDFAVKSVGLGVCGSLVEQRLVGRPKMV